MDVIRSPFYEEIPNVFSFEDNIHPKIQYAGPYAQLLKNFGVYHNYKIEMVFVQSYNISQIQKDIESGHYNLSVFGGTYLNLFANISFSYPLEWTRACIMVPSEKELPHYWYVVWPLGIYIWLLLAVGVPYVALLMTLLKYPSANFFHNLLESFSLLVLFYANACCKLANIPTRSYTVHLLLLPLGFILFNYYTIYLTAYNFRPIFRPYLKTIEDILAAGMEVYVPSQMLEEFHNNPYVNLTALLPVIVEKTQHEVSALVRNLSQANAFVVTRSQWIFMQKLQSNLIQPLYQLSDICFGYAFMTYPVQLHAKFASSLDYFILLVQQSGLWDHWHKEAFLAARKAKHYEILNDEYPTDPLDLYYYSITWILYFIGIVLSGICFIGERILSRWRKSK